MNGFRSRSIRAQLADAFFDYLGNPDLKITSRCIHGYGQTAFVFLVGSSKDRQARVKELGLRCHVVRAKLPNVTKIVGIATDRPGGSEIGYSSDIAYLNIPELTEEYITMAKQVQSELGYFKNL